MKSLFLPKYEQKIVKISALTTKGRNHDNFLFIYVLGGRNEDFINSIWNCLTFKVMHNLFILAGTKL